MRKLLFALLALPSFASAEAPSPEDVAKIQFEQQKANADIDKKYGNKKPSELSNDERREMMKEKAAAERDVLDKHGVSAKDFARTQAKQSLDDRAKTRDANDKLQKDASAKKPAADDNGVIIEKGNGSANPDSDAAEAAAMDKASGYGKTSGGTGKKKK
jgi:hypothetical protein